MLQRNHLDHDWHDCEFKARLEYEITNGEHRFNF